jgi:hypothetical protein
MQKCIITFRYSFHTRLRLLEISWWDNEYLSDIVKTFLRYAQMTQALSEFLPIHSCNFRCNFNIFDRKRNPED